MSGFKGMKSDLMKGISISLVDLGFDSRIHGQSFWKSIEHGRAMVHLSFINHVIDFDVTVDVGIRLDELEDMINQGYSRLTENEKKNTATIGVELGNLTQGKQKRWTIASESDIDTVVIEIVDEVRNVAIPYIEKFSDLENVLEICRRDDPEAWDNSPIDYKRAINAIGLAKLMGKNELLESLIKDKTKYLQEQNDYGLPIFLEFVKKINVDPAPRVDIIII